MKTVCISLETLYNEIGENLTHAVIEKTYQEETDTTYYDLRNNSRDLVACMDGEEVQIISENENVVEFLNTNGEIDMIFKLSKEEFNIATFEKM